MGGERGTYPPNDMVSCCVAVEPCETIRKEGDEKDEQHWKGRSMLRLKWVIYPLMGLV
jgi:hypothetical protein